MRLFLTRMALGATEQGAFAATAGIGKSAYNNYEKAKRIPNLEHAVRLCDTYELTLDWIYRGDPSGLTYVLANKIKEIRPLLLNKA